MKQVIKDAAHHKYKHEDILAAEFEILRTLSFNISFSNVYQESSIIYKNLLKVYKRHTF